MSCYQDEAFILKATPLKETDQILTLLSAQYGQYQVMAYGIAKLNSKRRGALQPFNYSKLLLRRGSKWDSVEQGEAISCFAELKESLEGLACLSYLAELASRTEREAAPAVLSLLLRSLAFWGQGESWQLLRSFESQLLVLSGIFPHLENCLNCGLFSSQYYFSYEQGGLLCPACSQKQPDSFLIGLDTRQILKLLRDWSLEQLVRLKVDARQKKLVEQLLWRFMQYHWDLPLKSRSFLTWLETDKNLPEGNY